MGYRPGRPGYGLGSVIGMAVHNADLGRDRLLIGGEPGSEKSALLNRMTIDEVVSESTCLACPDGCGSCTRDESDCECYEHQGLHPLNELADGREAA